MEPAHDRVQVVNAQPFQHGAFQPTQSVTVIGGKSEAGRADPWRG